MAKMKLNMKKITKGTQDVVQKGAIAGLGIVETNLIGWGFDRLINLIPNAPIWLSGGMANTIARIAGIIFVLPVTPFVKEKANIKIAQAAASAQIVLSLARQFIPATTNTSMEMKRALLGDWRTKMGYPGASNTGLLPGHPQVVGNIGKKIPRKIRLRGYQVSKSAMLHA